MLFDDAPAWQELELLLLVLNFLLVPSPLPPSFYLVLQHPK